MSNEEQALQKRPSNGLQSGIEIRTMQDVQEVGQMIAHSGMFSDIRDASQAGVKILAGQELGIPPMAAIRGVHVFDGQTTISGPLLAALIKRHPKYDYREEVSNDKEAAINFYEHGEHVGVGRFTIQEARDAGLLGKRNWQNYREDMLFWRALSRGKKRYAAEVGNGPLYVPDEIGVETDAQNNPVDAGEARVVDETPDPAPESEDAPAEKPTWRGEAVSKKQLGALQRIEGRLSSATSYADFFSLADKLREYAVKKPDAWGERVTTLIREAEVAQHRDDALNDEVLEVARNCGGKVLSRHLTTLEQHYGDAWSDVKWQALPWSVTAHLQRCSEKDNAASIVRQALQHCAEGEEQGHYTEQERARAESIIAEAAYHLHDIDAEALEAGAEAEGDLFGEPEPTHNDQG